MSEARSGLQPGAGSRAGLALAVLGFGLLSSASAAPASPSTSDAQIQARYAVYAHGLHVANAVADYRLQPWGYGLTTTIRAGGLMSWFLKMNVRSTASGRFDAETVMPISFDSTGFSRGADRHIAITYANNVPNVTAHTPPDTDRDPVAPAMLPHAIDTLSAMALLLHTLQTTGRCDGSIRIFDGVRLTAMQSRGPVAADVPEGDGEFYKGPAMRCDFVGQQIAGFITNSPHLADMKKARPGSAWFQTVPGLGLVAVRIEFDHPKLGHLTGVLMDTPSHSQ